MANQTETQHVRTGAAALKGKVKSGNHNLAGYLFIMPFIIGLFAFNIIPIGMSFYLSMTKYNMLGTPEWVGLDNYVRMFTNDSDFWQAMEVTFFYVFTAVPLRLLFALLVALLLASVIKASGFYRTVLYLPSIIGGSVAIAVMWKQLFGRNGAVNGILEQLGLPTKSWLGDPDTAIWALVILAAWQFGSSMLIFLAGLKNIPTSFYEAASVDGANVWYRFFRITLPLLTPIILFNVVMQMISGFMAFTPSYIITEGGPLKSTMLYVFYMFQRGFQFFEMGYASAMAWVMLIIVAIFTALVFKSSEYWVHYESGGDR